jgi:hypothetical protein
MNNSHPSVKEIQQYAIDRSDCAPELTAHIDTCAYCISEMKAYQTLFSAIKNQPEPVFDFDLSGLVLSQLPETGPRLSPDNIIAWFLVIFTCCCVVIPAYLFRKSILYLFTGIPIFFIYAIMISSLLILLVKIFFLYKKYQNQMRQLNFT